MILCLHAPASRFSRGVNTEARPRESGDGVVRPNRLVQLPAADAGSRIESGIAARELGEGRS